MPGEGLLEDFKHMGDVDQASILGQMADVLACFQKYQLPNTIKGCGGLRFDDSGEIVSGPLGFVDEGPFDDYVSLIRGTIQAKLRQADSNLQLKGWKTKGIRERLDDFLEHGLSSFLEGMPWWRKVIVHGDFSTDNVLYDKRNNRLTAVLDFDFAHIGSVADDFFRSLGHDIGRFPDTMQTEEGSVALRQAMLDGFPDPLPAADDDIRWPAAKAWDNAMRERHMDRPGTISGITKLADVYGLHSLILPFRITNPVVIANSSPDQLLAQKEITEAKIIALLDKLGY